MVSANSPKEISTNVCMDDCKIEGDVTLTQYRSPGYSGRKGSHISFKASWASRETALTSGCIGRREQLHDRSLRFLQHSPAPVWPARSSTRRVAPGPVRQKQSTRNVERCLARWQTCKTLKRGKHRRCGALASQLWLVGVCAPSWRHAGSITLLF